MRVTEGETSRDTHMRSMTGYGSASVAFPGGQVSAELRTVNHRFLEMKMLLPRLFLPWEDEFRQQISAQVGRGRLELTLSLAGRAPRTYSVSLNRELAQAYREAFTHLQKDLGLDGPLDLQLLASRPELFQVVEKPGLSPAELQAARKAVQDALRALERQRSREGKFLQRDLRRRIASVSKVRRAVAARTDRVQTASRDKLAARVRTFLAGTEVDQTRLLHLSLAGRAPRTYSVSLNRELAQAYREAFTHLQKDLGLDGPLDLQLLASRPELFQVVEKPGLSPAELQAARKAVQDALRALERQRSREGKFLQRDLRRRIASVSKVRRAVAARTDRVQTASRDKLAVRVRTFLAGTEVDQTRLLQEVVSLTQKSDITEELVRLHSHLEAMLDLLRKHEPVGKRMDFLLQEINREINTIGAKADDAPIRHLVVEAKEEVEKLREQVQNIE